MRNGVDRSFLTRLLRATGLALALMIASAVCARAETVIVQGAGGATGADGVNPADSGQPGGDGGPAAANAGSASPQNSATAIGGNGGSGGSANNLPPFIFGGNGGNGGNGGAANAAAATTITSGSAGAEASASGGVGGEGGGTIIGNDFEPINGFGGNGGVGGSATALATGRSGRGNVSASASAMGGAGGVDFSQLPGGGADGPGGAANATADASAGGGGTATANAVANGGIRGDAIVIVLGAANATSNAETKKGAMAQAQSTATGTTGEAGSTAKTSLDGVTVQSAAMAASTTPLGVFLEPETTIAIAQAGSDPSVPNNLFQTTYAFSTVFPDEGYVATLIGAASNVADALLGPSDKVFGTAILGEQGIGDSASSTSSTFDFRFRGDLLLGSIEDDSVINLGSSAGGIIDLTLSGPGIFVIGGAAVPEASTWAMMLAGFAGLGFAGYRRARPTRDRAA
jgi:hypothetical protein